MRDTLDAVLKFAAHDPFIAIGILVLTFLVVPLGGLHFIRIFLGFLVLLLQEFKRELHGIGKVLGRVWVELTTWRVDE
jgi:hypothetical protein